MFYIVQWFEFVEGTLANVLGSCEDFRGLFKGFFRFYKLKLLFSD